MRTNIAIDDDLMAEAMQVLGAKTKKEAVEQSLRRTVTAARQLQAFRELKGIGWEGDLDDMRTSKHLPSAE
jgi:Arc/MetJ family transcription regulator